MNLGLEKASGMMPDHIRTFRLYDDIDTWSDRFIFLIRFEFYRYLSISNIITW